MNKTNKYSLSILIISLLVIVPRQAYAMHIMEGFLPIKWALFWFAISIPFIVLGIKKISKITSENINMKMLLGLCGAFVFVLSSLKLPSVTGSCSHPTGVGLSAVLFGPNVTSILALIALLFQALLLAHGGISTLGANVFSMGIAGPVAAYLIFKLSNKSGLSKGISIFLAASVGDLVTYIVTSIQLGIAFPAQVGGMMASVGKFMGIFAITQIPLAISEGLLTVIVYNLLTSYNSSDLQELAIMKGEK
ncbi:MAG: cobalt/nickel transport system permease protein [Candidatus Petromonas sp.]|jgi:cobalt/nickel transport system permease protein|nr:cobalt/nickel transport system permease protein [Candidatus Petromonas sp.]